MIKLDRHAAIIYYTLQHVSSWLYNLYNIACIKIVLVFIACIKLDTQRQTHSTCISIFTNFSGSV